MTSTRERAERLHRVDAEERPAGVRDLRQRGEIVTIAVNERDPRHGDDARPRRHRRGQHASGVMRPSDGPEQARHDALVAQREPRPRVRTELVVGQDDLVARPPIDAARDHVGAVGRVAQERDLVAARADEPPDARAVASSLRFDGRDAEDAAAHLSVDGGDERVARAHRQRSGGRVVEIDEALGERERVARQGRVRATAAASIVLRCLAWC